MDDGDDDEGDEDAAAHNATTGPSITVEDMEDGSTDTSNASCDAEVARVVAQSLPRSDAATVVEVASLAMQVDTTKQRRKPPANAPPALPPALHASLAVSTSTPISPISVGIKRSSTHGRNWAKRSAKPKRPHLPPRLPKGSLPRPSTSLPRKSGFLMLRFLEDLSAPNQWREYWCVFEKDEFRYFRSVMEPVPLGVLPRSEIIQIHRNRDPDTHRVVFEVQCRCKSFAALSPAVDAQRLPLATIGNGAVPGSRRILFYGDGVTDADEWFRILSAQGMPPPTPSASTSARAGAKVPKINTATRSSSVPLSPPPVSPRNVASHALSSRSINQLASSVEEIEKQGWLRKQGGSMTREWKRRFVVIKNGRIFYYKTMEARETGASVEATAFLI